MSEEMKKNDLPKPKRHSVISNIIYSFKPTAENRPLHMLWYFVGIVVKVLVPVLASYASALVVSMASGGHTIVTVIFSIGAVFAVYGLVTGLSAFFEQMNQMHFVEGRLGSFFQDLDRKWLSLSLSQMEDFSIRKRSASAGEAVGNNSDGIENIMRKAYSFAADALGLLVYILCVGLLDLKVMAVIALLGVVMALLSLVSMKYYNKAMQEYFSTWGEKDYLERTASNITAGKDIRVFDLSPYLSKKYEAVAKKMTRARGKYYFVKLLCSDTAGAVLAALRDLVCYLYLISRMQSGMAVSDFVFYLGLISGFAAWFTEIGVCMAEMKKDSRIIDSFRDFVDMAADMPDEGDIPAEGFEQVMVEFDHVSFAYPGTEDRPVLKDVSFRLAAGEHVAVVGTNGTGKSTLVKLMSGLYLPTSGAVRINGIDTRTINRRELMHHEAAIFQQPFITDFTIAENVAFSEEADDDGVTSALQMAGLSARVEKLPKGIHTNLGKHLSEDGVCLSGGETQKLLMARALYRDSSLVFLDEPTAALDALAEQAVYENYSDNMEGRTAVFISHRLASTKFCDRILLLDDGRIAEEGTHDELIRANGEYAELFNVQAKYYQENTAEEAQA